MQRGRLHFPFGVSWQTTRPFDRTRVASQTVTTSKRRVTLSPRNRTTQAALSIVYRNVEDLQPNPKNPRRHPKKQIRQIARSIQTFGFNAPFLVDRNLQLIAGHGRLEAAK